MIKFLKKSYVFLVFAFLYAPIVILMLYSFNESKSRGRWDGFSLKWYQELLNDNAIMTALQNTVIIALVSAIFATIIGTAATLGMHFMGKRTRSLVMNVTYLPVMNPDIVTGVSLMLLFIAIKVPLGFTSILIAHITFNIPYVILCVQPKLKQLNKHLFEAAEDLGASMGYTFFKVILPEIMPGIITAFLLSITLSIDDFVISFFTKGAGVSTLSIQIYAMARRGVNPSINALSTIMFISVLAMLIIINMRTKNKNI